VEAMAHETFLQVETVKSYLSGIAAARSSTHVTLQWRNPQKGTTP
jgi:hypothetical protein